MFNERRGSLELDSNARDGDAQSHCARDSGLQVSLAAAARDAALLGPQLQKNRYERERRAVACVVYSASTEVHQ